MHRNRNTKASRGCSGYSAAKQGKRRKALHATGQEINRAMSNEKKRSEQSPLDALSLSRNLDSELQRRFKSCPATNSSIRRSYETAVGFNASSSRRDRAGVSKRGLALAESGICSLCPFRRPCLSDGSEPTEPGEGGRRNMDKFFSNISLMQRKTKVREPPRIPSLSGRLSDQICPNVVSSNVHRRRK